MAIDAKYGRVTLERGTIGEDEPVVVFRAQDELSVRALAVYAEFCELVSSPEEHLEQIQVAIREFNAWQAQHRTKIPGTTGTS